MSESSESHAAGREERREKARKLAQSSRFFVFYVACIVLATVVVTPFIRLWRWLRS